jgi:hypothetical protein
MIELKYYLFRATSSILMLFSFLKALEWEISVDLLNGIEIRIIFLDFIIWLAVELCKELRIAIRNLYFLIFVLYIVQNFTARGLKIKCKSSFLL